MTKRLPPFGKKFQPVPSSGVRVALGPGAWDFANRHHCPIMVLPQTDIASSYTWPTDDGPALVHQRGETRDNTEAEIRLAELAKALLVAGACSVVALREAYLNDDPRVFFDPEVSDVEC